MNADTYELKTILTLERRYIIPTFQRDYEWTQQGQWELLFEDLESVADRLEEARRLAEALGQPVSRAEKQVAPHFLGAIVLDLLPSSAGSLDLRSVIDGQQRLTTLQLLVRGVLDVLLEVRSTRVSQVRRLIFNPSDVTSHEDDRFKLWPRRRDRDVWRVAMADEAAPKGGHLYFKAREFFREKAKEIVVAPDGTDRSDLLVDVLLSLFKLVVIDLEDNDDAQIIFEVLNGRQTPLSATDLVKNLLFLRAELTDEEELEELYDKHWAHFDDAWWKTDLGRGHAARGRRDVLLSSWLTAATRTEVNVGHLYGEVRRYLDNVDRKIVDILVELSTFAHAFREIFDRPTDLDERVAEAYRRLERLGVTTALPLLVWLNVVAADRIPGEEHLRSVVAIESWVIRRLLVGTQTRGYGKRFVDVMIEAETALAKDESVAEAVERALLAGGRDKLVWPTDTELEAAFVDRKFYDSLSQERIRMFLGAIDKQMHKEHPKGESPTFDYEKLQIEHILPQKWREHWAVTAPEEAARLLLEQEREKAKNRIGNLTLITGPLNTPMSNGPWNMKRPALKEHSKLELNVGPVGVEEWNEQEIEARARELAAIAARVWPRPDGPDLDAETETQGTPFP